LKVVISSFGSSGDFNPCLGLARSLRQKGVDVLFLSNPYYEKKITEAGLTFIPAGDYWDVFKEIQDNPKFLHPRKGPKMVWELVLKTIPVMYPAMTNLITQEKPDMVACHILEFGGTLAAIQNHIPYATLSPTPLGWFGVTQPGYINYFRTPLWFRRFQIHTVRFLIQIAHDIYLKPYCRKKKIPNPIKKIEDSFGKASVNLGLWSELLRPKATDDPPNSHICGFVRDEHIKDWPDVPDTISNLFAQDRKPVVIGMGSTASLHGAEIYQNTAAICRQLNQPCLMIGKDLSKYAEANRNILAVDFAPYGWVFPRAAAVIHHGGLNTTAETLRAGVPALVIPHAYDQFDNAIRTERMGVSKRLKVAYAASRNFAPILESILGDTGMQERAKAISKQLQAEPDGGCAAVDHIIQEIL
jgi:UDP:flavonoid glycosyltransferase YjiC (YdhE family)